MDYNGEIAFGCIRVMIINILRRRRFVVLLLLILVLGLGSRLDGICVVGVTASAIIAFARLDVIITII